MGPEHILLVQILLGVTLYAVFGGADFGAGVWEFHTVYAGTEREQSLLYRAVGPVWEANHVWLIFVLVALHTGFPRAFAAASRAMWVPASLALVGIVFRGASFAFRSYADRQRTAWDAVFALASIAAPFFLGAIIGAIASGRLAVTGEGDFTGDHLTGWISPLSIFMGFFAVGACAYLAAVFMIREASTAADAEQVDLWRRRAIVVGTAIGVLALAGLAYVAAAAPVLWDGFRSRAWPLVGASLVAGALSLVANWRRRFMAADIGATFVVATVVWGWGVAQYPVIIPPTIAIDTAKAPDAVLRTTVWVISGGTLLIVPSLGFLMYLFKLKPVTD